MVTSLKYWTLSFFQKWQEATKNKRLLRKATNFQMLERIICSSFFPTILFFPIPPLIIWEPSPLRLEIDCFQGFLCISWSSEQAPVKRAVSMMTLSPPNPSSLWWAYESWLLVAATPKDKMQTKQIIHFQGLLTERGIYLWNIYCSVSGENHVIIAREKAWKVLYFA